MKFEPLSNRVILYTEEETKEIEKSAGGIYLPPSQQQTSKNNQTIGIVREVGPDCEQVKVGDKVIYDAYSGSTVKFGNKLKHEEEFTILIVSENDISVIIREEETTNE